MVAGVRDENSFSKIGKYDIPSMSKCVKDTVVFHILHPSSWGPQLMLHKLNLGVL